MFVKRCDRCGKDMKYDPKDRETINRMMLINVRRFNSTSNGENYDLCPECVEKIREFLKGDK